MRYDQIKPTLSEEVLDEVNMSPSALQQFANSPEAEGMLMGIEFEMCVPNVGIDDDSGDGEYDYDMDERAMDIDDIIRFFREGEMSNLSASGADRLRSEMWDQYLDWVSEKVSENLDTDELDDRIRDRLDGDIDFDDMTELAREQWTEANPDKNPEDKESEDEIHQMALALNEKTLDDMMEDTSSRDYQRAYDDIRQEMEDEMRDDWDQSEWLSDLGISYMSEAQREWNLDWPHWTYYGGDGELDVETVGDEFGRAMGLEYVNTSNNYHGARRDGVNWIVEPDSSIDADEGDGGLEFVSPPMPIKDGLAMLEKMYAWAKKEGCYTNKSTGLHMNISVPDMSIENLDYVKLALFLGDEHVLREFDRQYNSYAKSAMSIVKEKIQQNPENATALLAKMKEHLNAAASKLVHTGITNKYTSINTKSNYVEFRGPGGDYLNKNPIDLINTVLRLSMSLRIATDENAYKQEYAKKLYKLVGPKEGEWTDPNNSVALFSRYALGQINKEELVSNVRQAQIARKEKKIIDNRITKDPAIKAKIKEMPLDWQNMLYSEIKEDSDQRIQSLINNLNNGVYDEQLTADQKNLAIAVITDELNYRKLLQDQEVQYWVMNKDGSGGKQMVFAAGETAAIILGGKQLGMSREESIRKLKAELLVDKDANPDTAPESLSQSWKDWIEDSLPNVTVDTINSVRERIRDGRDGLDQAANAWIIRQIDAELRNRMDQGVVDGNETRWKVYFARGENANRPIDAVFVDADSPRQAKLKAVSLFQREGVNANVDDLDAIATTQDAGQETAVELPTSWALFVHNITNYSDEVLANTKQELLAGHMDDQLDMAQGADLLEKITAEQQRRSGSGDALSSLSEEWQTWLGQVGTHANETLENMLRTIEAGVGDVVRMTPEQRNLITTTIHQELRSRQTTNYNDLAANARRAENEVRASLPQAHREFLDDLANKSDIGLINILRNNNVYQGVSDQAAAYFRIQLKHELRRRGINPGSEEEANLVNNQAADQQAELINRDDPVTANDPEADSPYIAQTTATDFEIVKRDGSVVSRISGGDMVYAHRQAREFEQNLGLEGGELSVRAVPAQTNESIKQLRKLAGLK